MRIAILNYHPSTNIGGSEIQCDLVSRELVRQGHHPVYLALNLPKQQSVAEEMASLPYPVLRLKGPSDVGSLLRAHSIDVLYWRCGRSLLLRTALAARQVHVPVIYAISGWSNVKPVWYRNVSRAPGLRSRLASVFQPLKGMVKSRLNWEGLKLVQGVISNTQYILDALPYGGGLPRLRKTIYNIAPERDDVCEFVWPRPFVAWVANLQRIKNPDTMVEIARRLPEIDFLMAGRIKESAFNYFADSARLPSNLHYLGPLQPSLASGMMAAARCLVHTCSPEGFSGNLIQAWRQGCPTIVLHHDPDGIIRASGAGAHAGGLERCVELIAEVYSEDRLRSKWSEAAAQLVEDRFNAAKNVSSLVDFCFEVLASQQEHRSAG